MFTDITPVEFVGVGGQTCHFNATSDYAIVRLPDASELQELVSRFKGILHSWSLDKLCEVATNDAGEDASVIIAFAAYRSGSSGEGPLWPIARVDPKRIPAPLFSSDGSGWIDRVDALVGMSISEQQALVRKAGAPSLEQLDDIIVPQRKNEYSYMWLFETAERLEYNARVFIPEIIARKAQDEAYRPTEKAAISKRPRSVIRSVVLDCFLLLLADQGVLLRPFRDKPFATFPRGLDDAVLSHETSLLLQRLEDSYAVRFKKEMPQTLRRNYREKAPRWRTECRNEFFCLFGSSNLRRPEQISTAFFSAYLANIPSKALKNVNRTVRFMYDEIRAAHNNPSSVPKLKFTKYSQYEGRFEWTRMSYSKSTATRFPFAILEGYNTAGKCD